MNRPQLFAQLVEAVPSPAGVDASHSERDVSTWERAVGRLLGKPFHQLPESVRESSLADPASTASASPGILAEVLEPVARGRQKAGVIFLLAGWWQGEFSGERTPQWTRSLEHYRLGLRQIRGLGAATVDDILLHAAGLPVFPLSRPASRVGVRHGWIDLPMEEESIQAFFRNEADRAGVELAAVSRIFEEIGERYCGRVPQCDACPLKPLLPERGPCHSDEV